MSKDLTDALDALTRLSNDQSAGLPEKKQRGNKQSVVSAGVATQTKAQGGGGINSPLNETAGTREYYVAGNIYTSSDGMTTWEVSQIKKSTFTDSSGNSVVINWSP